MTHIVCISPVDGKELASRGASLPPIGFHMLTRPKSFHLREV